MLFVLIISNTNAESNGQNGKTYHINQSLGNNQNEGTYDKPFSTISKCAELASAGDTCLVHEGTYRETVRPHRNGNAESPITFIASPGEKVVVTGLDKLTSSWKKVSPSIFFTEPNTHVKQLFINNRLIKISQFPNSVNQFKPKYATISSAQCITPSGTWSDKRSKCKKYDEDGPCNKVNNCWNRSYPKQLWRISSTSVPGTTHWKGGTIAIVDGGSYNAERAVITQSNSKIGIEFEWFAEKPLKIGMEFTIANSLAAIDSDGEWSYDSTSRTLFIDPPGSSAPQNIFIRTRDLAFDLRESKHITVKGFQILAGSIETGPNSTGCILDQLDVSYPVYHQMFGATKNFPGQGPNRHQITAATMGKGITLGGNNNMLKNSKISHSWCDGVTIYGSNNHVVNNDISDVNWSMTACAAVATHGSNHQINNNLMHDCGRSCLWHQQTFDSNFSYNDIFNACWLGKDCGVTGSYAWYGKANDASSDKDGDGVGNTMHHNWIHDNRSEHGGACLYLDNNEQAYLLHHNVLWGCKFALIMNDTYRAHGPTGHQVYNNTCFDVGFRNSDFGSSKDWQLQGVKYINNLCTTNWDLHYNAHSKAEIQMENNVSPGKSNAYAQSKPAIAWTTEELMLKDINNRDFRPNVNSPALNQGRYIRGITDKAQPPYAAGAYEYGENDNWKAGPQ